MMKRNTMISAIVLTALVCAIPTFSAAAKTPKASAKPAALEVAPPDKPEDVQARLAETQKQIDELQQQKTGIEQQKVALDAQLKENTVALAEKKKQVDALKSKKKKK